MQRSVRNNQAAGETWTTRSFQARQPCKFVSGQWAMVGSGCGQDRAMMEGATPLLAAALQGHAEAVWMAAREGRLNRLRPAEDGWTYGHGSLVGHG